MIWLTGSEQAWFFLNPAVRGTAFLLVRNGNLREWARESCQVLFSSVLNVLIYAVSLFVALRLFRGYKESGRSSIRGLRVGAKDRAYVERLTINDQQLTTTLQLLLPAQNSRLVAFFFGFRNHAFFLIKDGEACVGQDIVRI